MNGIFRFLTYVMFIFVVFWGSYFFWQNVFPPEQQTSFEHVPKEATDIFIDREIGVIERYEERAVANTQASILFAGDVMLDRHVRTLSERNGVGWLTEPVSNFFTQVDGSVYNLEGPITSHSSVSQYQPVSVANHFRFTFDPKHTQDFFQTTRPLAVSLGNNHALNFGIEGLQETRAMLEADGIGFFGSPDKKHIEVFTQEVGGEYFSFIAYNWFDTLTLEDVLVEVSRQRELVDWIIIVPHWGVEYALEPTQRQREEAHALIDAGADVIVGAHPHVVQNIEVYNNKMIFYSLGNFVFDQYFSRDVRERLLVEGTFSEMEMSFSFHPVIDDGGQLYPATDQQRVELIDRISQRLPQKQREEVSQRGTLTLYRK